MTSSASTADVNVFRVLRLMPGALVEALKAVDRAAPELAVNAIDAVKVSASSKMTDPPFDRTLTTPETGAGAAVNADEANITDPVDDSVEPDDLSHSVFLPVASCKDALLERRTA